MPRGTWGMLQPLRGGIQGPEAPGGLAGHETQEGEHELMIFGRLKFAYVLLQTLSHFPEEAAYDVALVIRGAGAERRALPQQVRCQHAGTPRPG